MRKSRSNDAESEHSQKRSKSKSLTDKHEIESKVQLAETAGSPAAEREKNFEELRICCTESPFILDTVTELHMKAFLHANENNAKIACSALADYYKTKKDLKQFFRNRDPMSQEIQESWNMLKVCFLPKVTREGYKILLVGIWEVDSDKLKIMTCMKMFLMLLDAAIFVKEHNNKLIGSEAGAYLTSGQILILDTEGLSLRYFPLTSLPDYNRFMKYLQYVVPLTIKQIHILKSSKLIERIYSIIKPFMKKELANILFFHSGTDLTEFHSKFPPEILPKELGGSLGSIRSYEDCWKVHVEALTDTFLTEDAELEKMKERISPLPTTHQT